MQTKCSCLDWSNPCKHIAAAFLILAVEFDKDPFLVFKLRGLALNDLFALLKSAPNQESSSFPELPQHEAGELSLTDHSLIRSASNSETDTPGSTVEPVKPENAVYGTDSSCLQNVKSGFNARTFWKSPIQTIDFESWSMREEVAPFPRAWGDFPFWQGNSEFLGSLQLVYESAPELCLRLLSGKDSRQEGLFVEPTDEL